MELVGGGSRILGVVGARRLQIEAAPRSAVLAAHLEATARGRLAGARRFRPVPAAPWWGGHGEDGGVAAPHLVGTTCWLPSLHLGYGPAS